MNDFLQNCTGVILAGGENTRMPVPKAFIEVQGEKIIERNLEVMKTLFKEIFIVTNQPELYGYLPVQLLGDVYDVRGPMTGILTSLLNSSNAWVFVTACDMPFINGRLIRYMAAKRKGYESVVPVTRERAEPLFSFYSRRLIPMMEKAVSSRKTGIHAFLRRKNVKYISFGEIKDIDTEAMSFINLNTPEDIRFYLRQDGVFKMGRGARS